MSFDFSSTLRQPEVISTPRIPPPMDTDSDALFDDFFNDLVPQSASPPVLHMQQMSMEQPPQQPAIDSMELQQLQDPYSVDCIDSQKIGRFDNEQDDLFDVTKQVIKQEKKSGFLDTWTQHSQQPECDELMSAVASPDEHKRMESHLIKEELSCRLQLKMLKEGKDCSTEADSNQGLANHTVSEETLELQRVRREKNREAAKKCRQKKKVAEQLQEKKLRDAEKELKVLRRQLDQERAEYSSLLNQFHSFPCFMAYLKQNRDALKSTYLKSVLQEYTRCQQKCGNVSQIKACTHRGGDSGGGGGSSGSSGSGGICVPNFNVEQ